MIAEKLVINNMASDLNRTYHWAASVRAGRDVITQEKVRRPRKAKASQSVTNFNNKRHAEGWTSKYKPESVTACYEEWKAGGINQKACAKKHGMPGSVFAAIQDGLYARAKQEINNG